MKIKKKLLSMSFKTNHDFFFPIPHTEKYNYKRMFLFMYFFKPKGLSSGMMGKGNLKTLFEEFDLLPKGEALQSNC